MEVPNWKQIRELRPKEVADFGLQVVKPEPLDMTYFSNFRDSYELKRAEWKRQDAFRAVQLGGLAA